MLKVRAERNDLDVDEVMDIKRQEVDGWTRVTSSADVDEAWGYLVNAALASNSWKSGWRLAVVLFTVNRSERSGDKRICSTCSEFLNAKDDGYWPLTQFDMNSSGMADRTVKRCAPSPRRDIPGMPFVFPASIATTLTLVIKMADRRVYGQFRRCIQFAGSASNDHFAHRRRILRSHDAIESTFEVTANGMAVRISEMFRADIDGDGEEEIVVFDLLTLRRHLRAGSVCVASQAAQTVSSIVQT